jgi:hypothetical protein
MLSGHARLRMPHGPRCNSSLGQLVGTKPISAVPSDGSSGYRLERSHRHPGRSAPTTPSRWPPASSIAAPAPAQPDGLPLSLRPAMTLCSHHAAANLSPGVKSSSYRMSGTSGSDFRGRPNTAVLWKIIYPDAALAQLRSASGAVCTSNTRWSICGCSPTATWPRP